MKKKALIVLLAVAFAFAFAGCGGEESGQTEETTAAEAETATEAAAEEETTTAAAEEQSGYQTIQMGNVEMDIPASWVLDEDDGAEMTHVYRNADGSVEFQIQAMQANSEVDDQVLGEMTQQYADEWGFGDVGYYDETIAGSIEGKIIPVDKTQSANGMYQQVITIGKGKTFDILTCQVADYDYTDFNAALKTVRFIN